MAIGVVAVAAVESAASPSESKLVTASDCVSGGGRIAVELEEESTAATAAIASRSDAEQRETRKRTRGRKIQKK